MKRTPLAERALPDYTRGEEICNMVTHIVGGALGILALVLCPVFGARHNNAWGVVCGTVFAFWLYLGSTQYIQPGEAGVLASVEPVTAIVISSLLLGQSFELMDIAGSALILLTVFILARR